MTGRVVAVVCAAVACLLLVCGVGGLVGFGVYNTIQDRRCQVAGLRQGVVATRVGSVCMTHVLGTDIPIGY